MTSQQIQYGYILAVKHLTLFNALTFFPAGGIAVCGRLEYLVSGMMSILEDR